MSQTKMQQSWDKRDDETAKAFDAFRYYLHLGKERTLQKVSDYLGHKSPITVRKWSMAKDWVSRVADWEAAVADTALEELEDERSKHRRIVYQNAWDHYEALMNVINKRIYDEKLDIDGALKLSSLINVANDHIRRSVGLPHRINESHVDATSNGESMPIAIIRMDTEDL